MQINIEVIKDTPNCCCKCNTYNGAWIYCPIYNLILSDDFDETGEKDGCDQFS